LVAPAPLTRARGWRASPLWERSAANAFSAKLTEQHQVALGFGLGDGMSVPVINPGDRALLAQEIRSARGGQFTFTVRASGGSSSAETFERLFLANFTCRLILFRFADMNKDPRAGQRLASADFRPTYSDGSSATAHSVSRFLGSTVPGANFSIGNGLGVAVVVEKTSPGRLQLPGPGPHQAFLRIHYVALEFNARPRDDSVTV